MFDLIYNFIFDNLLSTASTDVAIVSANSQLALILAHVSIILIFICFVLFVRFMFSITSCLFFRR